MTETRVTLQFTVTPKEWVPLLNLGKEKQRPIFPASKYPTCTCGRKIKSERHVCEGDYVVDYGYGKRTHRASGRPWKPDPPRGHDGRRRVR